MKQAFLKALRYHAEYLPSDDRKWDEFDEMIYRAMRGHIRNWLNDSDLSFDDKQLLIEILNEEDNDQA